MWVQWAGFNIKEVKEFCNGQARFIYYKNMKDKRCSGLRLEVTTKYGVKPVEVGQFIYKNGKKHSLDLWLRPKHGMK